MVFKIYLEGHNSNQAKSILTIIPFYTDFGIETKMFNKILREMATIYVRLINQYKLKYHIIFSASFHKINEEDQRSDEIELFLTLNNSHKLIETDMINIDVKSQTRTSNSNSRNNESVWIFDKINSMKLRLYKTGEINASSYVKNPFRANTILIFENKDEYCFIRSILAYIQPCENDHPSRVRNYIKNFHELNFEGFDFSNGFKCIDMHRFEKLIKSSLIIFEINFYEDQNKRKHNLIPTEM